MAVGLAKLHKDPPRNPLTRLVRHGLRKKTLACLERLQAADDSFLASPFTTAFVVMSLASMGCQDHPIVERGIEFLLTSVRADASWSVATSFATTNTARAVESLAGEHVATLAGHENSPRGEDAPSAHWQETASANDTIVEADRNALHPASADDVTVVTEQCAEWLLKTQHAAPSELTGAPAGGWGVSDAPGGPPNTIATAGALMTLAQACRLESPDSPLNRAHVERGAGLGVGWLLEMQNGNGGWPTYFRNDGSQPLDSSGIDPTAAALRALAAWQQLWKTESRQELQPAQTSLSTRIGSAIGRAVQYLESQQCEDGRFIAQWFGNEHQQEEQNPVLGTAQVLAACADLGRLDSSLAQQAAAWLVAAQHSDGGWGPPRAPVDHSGAERASNSRSWRENDTLAKFCSIEETAAATSSLLPLAAADGAAARGVSRGLVWLTNAVEQDGHRRPAIIGFYFSRIWYYERMYPLAFAAGALSRAVGALAPAMPAETPVR